MSLSRVVVYPCLHSFPGTIQNRIRNAQSLDLLSEHTGPKRRAKAIGELKEAGTAAAVVEQQ